MAKKVTTTSAASADQAASGTAPAKKRGSASRPKHLKAQAVAVAAAVEGFVQSLSGASTEHVEKPAEIEQNQTSVEPVAEVAPPMRVSEPAPAVEAFKPTPVNEAAAPHVTEAPLAEQEASPLTVEISHAEISALAYRFFLERGGQNGSPADDWFRAEEALRSGRE